MGNLIGISGKKRSGKDTVGLIIQYIVDSYKFGYTISKKEYNRYLINHKYNSSDFKIKKFADKLKDIVCLLINCTREQLEDEVFKNTELGEKWSYYRVCGKGDKEFTTKSYNIRVDENDCLQELRACNNNNNYLKTGIEKYSILKFNHTPRTLLQLLGTECGRDIIHPNIWLNSLFSEYIDKSEKRTCPETGMPILTTWEEKYPNWIITDVRFPNEADIIKEKGGLLIRIESPRCNYDDTHSSETALDNYGGTGNEVRTDKWDSVIFNDGTIEELIEKVKKVLIKHKIINNV